MVNGCVIGLGKHLFYNSAMEACILFCRTRKEAAHRGKIILIDARELVTREGDERFLTEEHIELIARTYDQYEDVEKFCKVISIEDAKAKDYALTLTKYIEGTFSIDDDIPDFETAADEWKATSVSWKESIAKLESMIGGDIK